MTRALHMRRPRQPGEGLDLRFSLCGMVAVDVTDEAVSVTCRLCRRALADAAARSAVAAVVEVLGVEAPAVRGAHALTSAARRAVERSRRGEDQGEAPRWRTLEAAYAHWARVLDDGAPVRSSSDPGRFERGGQDPTSGGGAVRTPSGRDDVADLGMAETRAVSRPLSVGPHAVGSERQRAILRARYMGRPVHVQTTGLAARVTQRRPMLLDEIAAEMGADWTPHQVAIVVRRLSLAMREDLVARGVLDRAELRRGTRAAKESDEMRVPGYDLEGWKAIADAIGTSVRTAQEHAKLRGLPICTTTTGGVRASSATLRSWLTAQIQAKAG